MDVEIIQLGKKGSIISFFWSNYFDFFENVTTLTKICFMHKPQIVRPFFEKVIILPKQIQNVLMRIRISRFYADAVPDPD